MNVIRGDWKDLKEKIMQNRKAVHLGIVTHNLTHQSLTELKDSGVVITYIPAVAISTGRNYLQPCDFKKERTYSTLKEQLRGNK